MFRSIRSDTRNTLSRRKKYHGFQFSSLSGVFYRGHGMVLPAEKSEVKGLAPFVVKLLFLHDVYSCIHLDTLFYYSCRLLWRLVDGAN